MYFQNQKNQNNVILSVHNIIMNIKNSLHQYLFQEDPLVVIVKKWKPFHLLLEMVMIGKYLLYMF